MILERFSLKGKTALVTGLSRGLGAGIALALAEAGANVAVHGLRSAPESTQELVSKAEAESVALVGDISDGAVCASLVERVKSVETQHARFLSTRQVHGILDG